MIEHLVIDVLKSYSNEEIKDFRKFIASQYFVKSGTLISMFEQLIKFHPNFNSKRLTKEYIYSKVFDSGKYNDSTLRNALSDLLDVCELFLKQENFRKSASCSFEYLLKELRSKKLYGVFQRNSSKIEKQYENLENVDSEYYLAKHKFELNKFNFNMVNAKINTGEEAEAHLNELFASGLYLTVHYIMEIIPIFITSVFYSMQYNRPLANDFFNKLISTLNIAGLEKIIDENKNSFVIKVYISLLKSFQNMDDENAYLEYKNVFRNNVNKFGRDEIWFHYSNLINYCMLKIRDLKKIDFYYDELFCLYEEILHNEYYKNKKYDYLRFELYRDILLMYLNTKRISQAENFILKYSSKLHKSEKDNMTNIAYTYLFYEKGDYMQSWKYLNKIKIDYFIYKYDVKTYALKIYYELGYYEEALSLIENYKQFLNRNELISESEKKSRKNFILFLSKLILIKVGQIPYKQFFTYRKRMELADDTTNKDWLLNKFDLFASETKQSRQTKSA